MAIKKDLAFEPYKFNKAIFLNAGLTVCRTLPNNKPVAGQLLSKLLHKVL